MYYITYNEIKVIYGQKFANEVLGLIERLADIQDNIILLDRDARLQRAFDALGSV